MTTFSDFFRYVVLSVTGSVALFALIVACVELYRDLRHKHRKYGGWNW